MGRRNSLGYYHRPFLMRHSTRYSSTGCLFPCVAQSRRESGSVCLSARETVSGRDMSFAVTEQAKYDRDKIKEILRISEGSLTVESQLIQVAAFLKKRYGSSMLQALKTVMPVKNKSTAPSGSHPVS